MILSVSGSFLLRRRLPPQYLKAIKLTAFFLTGILSQVQAINSSGISARGIGVNVCNAFVAPKEIQIRGRVLNEQGEPLAGASVQVKATAKTTLTDSNGYFSITAGNNDVLVISFIGMKTLEVNVESRTVINVSLEADATSDDEVVVTGYRTMRKSDFTGSITQISGDDLQKAPVANFSQALEGRVPGLQVQFADGQPGETPTFIMRGPNSLNNSTQPLYIIDGFQLENFNPAAISMDDIESVSFLKDASSVSQYGARGANGVVIITTKKGQVSKPQISFNAAYGFNSNRKKIPLMSAYDFLKVNDFWITDPISRAVLDQYFSGGKTIEDYKDYKGIDYQDYIFTKGKVKRYNVSMRGGNDITKYMVSGSYFDEDGSIIYTGSRSYSARFNLENNISKKLKLTFVGDYSGVKRIGPFVREGNGQSTYNTSTTLMYRVWAWRPVPFPWEDEDDLIMETDEGLITASDMRVSPITDYENQKLNYLSSYFNGSIAANYQFNKVFSFKSTFTDRLSQQDNSFFYNEKTSQGRYRAGVNEGGPWGGYTKVRSNSILNENQLNINPDLGKSNRLTAILVQGLQNTSTEGMGYSSNYLPFPQLGVPGLESGTPRGMTSYLNEDSRIWVMGRVDYSFLSKYIVNASLRSEGSSKFLGKNKWGYFPSFGVAWNMEKEKFMKNASSVLSTSRLRFSYGISGNDRIGVYDAFDKLSYTRTGYPFDDSFTGMGGVINSSLRNESLRWETTYDMDIGYEIGLFKNRLRLEATVYKKKTENLLYRVILSPSSGYGTAFKNIGSLENKGIEIELNTVNVQNKNFQWRSTFNITANRNMITFLQEDARSMLTSIPFESNFSNLYIQKVGNPTGMMIGYVSDGLYQLSDFYNPAPGVYTLKEGLPINNASNAVGPGYLKYKDLNGDGIIDANDLTIIGRGQPLHYGGFANTLSYKRVSLYALLSWVYGNNIYNANRHTFEGNSNTRPFINQFASYSNRWTFENQDTDIPTLTRAVFGKAGYYTSQYVEDGSFLRLKTVNLDYLLPVTWTKRIGLTSVNVYFSAQNLLTWTNYSGLDPQVSVGGNQVLAPGFDYSAYPPARTFTFGLKASF